VLVARIREQTRSTRRCAFFLHSHILKTHFSTPKPCLLPKSPRSWAFIGCVIVRGMSTRGKNHQALHSTPRIELSSPSCLFSCATTGEGLFEGLQWLSQNVKKRQRSFFSSPRNPAHPVFLLHRALSRLRYTHHLLSVLCYTLHRSADLGLFHGLCMMTQTRLYILVHTYVPMRSPTASLYIGILCSSKFRFSRLHD
jgi:hypothetical protein